MSQFPERGRTEDGITFILVGLGFATVALVAGLPFFPWSLPPGERWPIVDPYRSAGEQSHLLALGRVGV